MIKEINDSNFEQEVLQSKGVIVVDFWADWCGPCKTLSPCIDQLAKEMKNDVRFIKVNIDQNPNTPSMLGVRSIPTLVLFKDGKSISTKIGAHPKNKLEEWIHDSIKQI